MPSSLLNIIGFSNAFRGYVIPKQTFRFRKMCSKTNSITESIRIKLKEQLTPSHLDVINESYMHDVPKDAETHFKVIIVSDKFNDLPLIKRHRLVNEALRDELQNGVHALSIVAKTSKQWQDSENNLESSPACRGGFGK